MIKAIYKKYFLQFKQASGTSRGILSSKETYFLLLERESESGIGECGLFRGLSVDDRIDYESKLQWICDNINLGLNKLLNETVEFPSIQFGLEQAFLSLNNDDKFIFYSSKFTEGKASIPINGLIWMGDKIFMQQQIKQKLQQGFTTLKMKIGAIDFESELGLLKSIRNEFSSNEIEIRVDANGAFTKDNALEKLKRLSELQLHSIEQPIKKGQWQEMANLCDKSPLSIALDEELIGIFSKQEKLECIQTINPQYIILKPSLVGGIQGSNEWINIATQHKIEYWITSALESNIGLNAIAQWTHTLHNPLPQGLGTGSLFMNNFDSPLKVIQGTLTYNKKEKWCFNL